jgi:hypothetical protein
VGTTICINVVIVMVAAATATAATTAGAMRVLKVRKRLPAPLLYSGQDHVIDWKRLVHKKMERRLRIEHTHPHTYTHKTVRGKNSPKRYTHSKHMITPPETGKQQQRRKYSCRRHKHRHVHAGRQSCARARARPEE